MDCEPEIEKRAERISEERKKARARLRTARTERIEVGKADTFDCSSESTLDHGRSSSANLRGISRCGGSSLD